MSAYPLPSSDEERARLMAQAAMYRPMTLRLFREAGLQEGMRVLDVGSGAGDVALLARELVGPGGAVVGYDADPAQVAFAQSRAAAAGIANVRFEVADTNGFASDRRFDAAVGRLTLMYHPDVRDAVRTIAGHVRPGGVVAFVEMNYGENPAGWPRVWPPLPDFEFDRHVHVIVRTMQAAGVHMEAGRAMAAALEELGDAHAWAEQSVSLGSRWATEPLAVLRAILPKAEALGVVAPGEIDLAAISAAAEAHAARCTPVSMAPLCVLAWARLP